MAGDGGGWRGMAGVKIFAKPHKRGVESNFFPSFRYLFFFVFSVLVLIHVFVISDSDPMDLRVIDPIV